MQKKIKLLIVEDHPVMRFGLSRLVQNQEDIELIGEAIDGIQGVELAATLLPDVILMDLMLPLKSGIIAIEEIKQANPDMRILAFSSTSDGSLIHRAISQGATGFIMKDQSPKEILHAIREVFNGVNVISHNIQIELIAFLQNKEHQKAGLEKLSVREREILFLMASGKTDQEIAKKFSIADGTVRMHISRTVIKLGLQNRNQAVLFAIKTGEVKFV